MNRKTKTETQELMQHLFDITPAYLAVQFARSPNSYTEDEKARGLSGGMNGFIDLNALAQFARAAGWQTGRYSAPWSHGRWVR